MKKILIVACALVPWVTSAATLTCTEYRPGGVSGISNDFGMVELVRMYPNTSGTTRAKWADFTINVVLEPEMATVLAGNYIQMVSTQNGTPYGKPHPGPQITANKTLYTDTIQCVESASNACRASITSFHLVLSSHPTLNQPIRIQDIPISGMQRGSSRFYASSDNIFLQNHITSTYAMPIVQTRESTTDAITFPDRIELGSLSEGDNVDNTPVVYEKNTNSIPVKLTANATAGGIFQVYGMPSAGDMYKPPFNLGIYVKPTAKPDSYTFNVAASWTCP